MLTKGKVLNLALALSKGGDSGLVREGRFLSNQGLSPQNEERVREICRIVDLIRANYSYLDSIEFEEVGCGKSPSVLAMLKKLEAGQERSQRRQLDLLDAIRSSGTDVSRLRVLVSEDHQLQITQLEDLLAALDLP